MPCRDDGYDSYQTSNIQIRLDRATQTACEMADLLRKHKLILHLSQDSQTWAEEHFRQDLERLKREKQKAKEDKVRKDAIAKLTKAEKQVLGIME